MALKRMHLGFTPLQMRLLEKLSVKLGLDYNNTIRYCLSRVAEQENVSVHRTPGNDSRK